MKMTAVAAALGIALTFLPAVQPILAPQTADAAQAARMSANKPGIGMYALEWLIVRPATFIYLVGAYITYPVAWLLDPLFGDNPERLKKTWIDEKYDYVFERPIGNFNWKSR